MESGTYGQPLQRTANIKLELVSGYTTGRLFCRLALGVSGNPTSNPVVSYDSVTANYNNTGPNAVTFQVLQTDDLASGPRTNLGSAVTLVAGGMTTVSFTPQAHYIEFKATANGPTEVRAQLTSQLTWTPLGFSKLDPFYDQTLVQGPYSPLAGLF
jgi:hypothetical protein